MPLLRNARRISLVGCFFLVLAAAGCSGPRAVVDNRPDLPEAFPNHTLAEIQQALLRTQVDTLSALRGKASLALRSPELKGNVTAAIDHRRSDSLYMSLTATLGIEAARMLITPDSFFVYDRINKKLTYGAMEHAAAVLPAAFTGDDVFRNLLGLLVPEPDVAWRVEADADYYHLRDEAGRRYYIVDPARWRVVRFEERTGGGELAEARTFSEFDDFGGVSIPRRIIFQRPLDDTSISMYYRELTLNPAALAMTLRVGGDVERVLIDENTVPANE